MIPLVFYEYDQRLTQSEANITYLCKYIGILFPKLFRPTLRKNCCSDQEKLLKFEAEGREFQKFFSITTTIFSHIRSEQFW